MGVAPRGERDRETEKNRQDIKAIFRRVEREFGTGVRGAGSHDVAKANGLVGAGTRRDMFGPTCDKGYSMSSFPIVPFHSAPGTSAVVAMVFALPAIRRGYQRLAKWIDGVAGVVFTGFGIALIVNR